MIINLNRNKKIFMVIINGIILILLIVGMIFTNLFIEPKKTEIIIVNKCDFTVSEFWEAVYAGMEEAVTEYDINASYINAHLENEINKQKDYIDEAIRKKPDLIILSASDYYEIGPYAEKILKHDIKLLLMDSDVNITINEQAPFIGTNSLKAGELLGEVAKSDEMILNNNNISYTKNAIVLVHYKGVQTSDDREIGIKKGYGEEHIFGTYSCDSDEKVAYNITKKLLTNKEQIIKVFATNESVTIGAAKAIDELNLTNKVQLYGFDGSKQHVQYLEKGVLDYTIIQSPYQMGYLAIKNGLELLEGEKKPDFIETDFLLINKENMYDLGYREILFPFVNKN